MLSNQWNQAGIPHKYKQSAHFRQKPHHQTWTSLDIAGECHRSSWPRTFSSLQLFMPSFCATCHWGSSTSPDLILEPAYPTAPQAPNSTQKVQISLHASVLLWGSAFGGRGCNKNTSLFSKVDQQCLQSILATKKKERGRKKVHLDWNKAEGNRISWWEPWRAWSTLRLSFYKIKQDQYAAISFVCYFKRSQIALL